MSDLTLVTGATGMVGSALVRSLVADDERVRILIRPTSQLDLLGGASLYVDRAMGDITDPESLALAMEGVTRVYHCAALVDDGRDVSAMHRVNVEGTRHVCDAALHAGVRKLVHVSSIAALGRTATGGTIDESQEWTPSPLNSDYARSKYDAELEVRRAVAEGLDACMVNPAIIFGEGRAGENTMQLVARARNGKLGLAPPGSTAIVDVLDVVDAMRAAMARGKPGERYVLAGENLSWTELFGTLSSAFGKPMPRTLPAWTVRAAGRAGSLASTVGLNAPLDTQRARYVTGDFRYDSTKARDELGIAFRSFAQTAQRLADAT